MRTNLQSKKIHKNQAGAATTQQSQNELDHVGRVKKVFDGINTTPTEIVKNDYDEIGRLSQKKIFPNNTFVAGGTKEFIERPSQGIVTQANTVDLARRYVLLEPTTDIKAINLNSYLAKIDPNAPQGVNINGLQTINFFKADGNQLVQTQTQEQDPFGLEIKPLSSQNSVNSNQYKFLNRQDIPELNGVSDLVNRFYDKQLGRFWSIDPKVDDGQHSFTPYHYSFNNPIRFSDPDGLMGESCCGDGADGIGNGMSLVENIYYSTRDLLTSSIATIGTAFASVFGDVKPQRINATYSSGSRTLSAEVIPKSEVAQEVAMSTLALASAIPSGGSAGTGILMAKSGTKASATSSILQVAKQTAKESKSTIEFIQGSGAKAKMVSAELPKAYKEVASSGKAKVYSDGRNYISPDLDGHNKAGIWKMADKEKKLWKKETRSGTYDAGLKKVGN